MSSLLDLIQNVFPAGAIAVASGPGSVATAVSHGPASYAEATAIGPGACANANALGGESHVVANVVGTGGASYYWDVWSPFGLYPFSFLRGFMGYTDNQPPAPNHPALE